MNSFAAIDARLFSFGETVRCDWSLAWTECADTATYGRAIMCSRPSGWNGQNFCFVKDGHELVTHEGRDPTKIQCCSGQAHRGYRNHVCGWKKGQGKANWEDYFNNDAKERREYYRQKAKQDGTIWTEDLKNAALRQYEYA